MDKNDRANLKREISILSKVQHPNIVEFIEHLEDSRYVYLVFERLEGKDLCSALESGAKLQEAGL